jgi:hypothetical protein
VHDEGRLADMYGNINSAAFTEFSGGNRQNTDSGLYAERSME